MFVQSERSRATTNNRTNNNDQMATSNGGHEAVGASLGSGNNNNNDFFKDLHLVSSFCTSVCSRDNDVRDVALDAIAKTVEDWLDGVGSPRHYQKVVSERNHRLQSGQQHPQQQQLLNGLYNSTCGANGTDSNYTGSSSGGICGSSGSYNGSSSGMRLNGMGVDVSPAAQTEEYVDLVALHLPIILRLAITCPFDNVREKCHSILQVVKSRGIPVPHPIILGPSAFIDTDELPALGTFNEKTQSLYVDAFLQNNRLDHVSQVMGYHPRYLEHFLRTQHFILRGDGPLPYDYRHYIAIMAAGRHQCNYLITLQKQEFILQGGDHKWLKGLAHIPAKLRNLYDINKILAHRPWLLNMSHIEQLTKGKDSWSLAEVVHAIVILTHFHSLCSFVFSSGVNQELDQAGGYHYPGTGNQQLQQKQQQTSLVLTNGATDDSLATVLTSAVSGGQVIAIEGAEEGAVGGAGGVLNGGLNGSDGAHDGVVVGVSNTRPEPLTLSQPPNISLPTATTLSTQTIAVPARLPLSPLPATPPSPTLSEPESVAMPITTLMQRMKTLSEQTQECTPGELAKRFEHVESQSAELGAVGGPQRAPAAEVGIFVHDPHFTYQDFAKRGEPQLIATFRVQDYSWDDHAYSLVNRLYNDVGNLLDDKFKTAYNLTYYTMGGRTDVDTSRFRRAIWNYIQCLLGIRHDDYDYGEINQLLERSLKTFIKSACCFPERITKRDYDRVLREFKHSEKVHVNLMVLEARKQAELLYALRTVNRYMTN